MSSVEWGGGERCSSARATTRLGLAQGGKRRGRLVEFHADHKLLLLSRGPSRYAELGRLVAAAKERRTDALFAAYEKGFMAALAP